MALHGQNEVGGSGVGADAGSAGAGGPMLGASVLALGGIVQPFTGDNQGITINNFFNMVQQVGQMGGWSDGQLLAMSKFRMTGAAQSFAWNDEKVKEATTFAEFKRLALERYDTEPQAVRMTKFLEARQGMNEDVRTFASRIQSLAYSTLASPREGDTVEKRRYAKELVDEHLKNQFVAGLRDPVRRFVLSKNPTSFEDAVKEAASEERNEAVTGGVAHVRALRSADESRSDEMTALHARLDKLEELLSRQAYQGRPRGTAGGKRSSRQQARASSRCYACLELGHFARECPQGVPVYGEQTAPKRTTNPFSPENSKNA